MVKVDLSRYDNSWYKPGSTIKKALWYFTNFLFFNTQVPFPSNFKTLLLRIFGAKVGKGVIIKPSVNIKYPWLLSIGNYVWIGENCWIDNLALVIIKENVCLSQGAFLLTGNHNYKKPAFDLMIAPITINEGAWIGAKAVVCPGVEIATHCVISVGSVVTKDTESYGIYSGVTAEIVGKRIIS